MQLKMISTSDIPTPRPEIIIVPAAPEHVRELRETIRAADLKEMQDIGISCAKGLWRAYKHGLMNKAALIDGKVAAVWGVGGTYLGETGSPWLLTSYEVKKISPFRFAHMYFLEVQSMLNLFPHLVNYVDADYAEAVRMLEIAGFTLGDPQKMGTGMYRKFEMRRA